MTRYFANMARSPDRKHVHNGTGGPAGFIVRACLSLAAIPRYVDELGQNCTNVEPGGSRSAAVSIPDLQTQE